MSDLLQNCLFISRSGFLLILLPLMPPARWQRCRGAPGDAAPSPSLLGPSHPPGSCQRDMSPRPEIIYSTKLSPLQLLLHWCPPTADLEVLFAYFFNLFECLSSQGQAGPEGTACGQGWLQGELFLGSALCSRECFCILFIGWYSAKCRSCPGNRRQRFPHCHTPPGCVCKSPAAISVHFCHAETSWQYL